MMARVLKFPADSTAITGESERDVSGVYRREFAFIWRCVRALGVPQSAAEDVVQEVFVVVHRRLVDFDPSKGSLRSWLFGIARLSALRYHRTTRRKDPKRLSAPTHKEPPQPDDVLARSQAAALVQIFLDGLDERRRDIFILHELEGLPAPEIAESLGLKLGTVYSRLRRARQQFQMYVQRQRVRDARGLKRHG